MLNTYHAHNHPQAVEVKIQEPLTRDAAEHYRQVRAEAERNIARAYVCENVVSGAGVAFWTDCAAMAARIRWVFELNGRVFEGELKLNQREIAEKSAFPRLREAVSKEVAAAIVSEMSFATLDRSTP